MEERFKFVLEASKGEKTLTQLCREYGISRPTGYKWFNRYVEDSEQFYDREKVQGLSLRVFEMSALLLIQKKKELRH